MSFAKHADMPSRPTHSFAYLLSSLLLAAPLSVAWTGLAHAGNAEAPLTSAPPTPPTHTALPVASAPAYAPASSGIPVAPAPQSQPQLRPQAGAFASDSFDREKDARFGVDGTMGGGLVYFMGASARYESASPEGTAMVLRAAYYRGAVIADEAEGFQALSAGVGFRAYSGVFYLGAEAALLAVRTDPYEGAIEWNVAPNGTGMVGAKLGPLDASLQLMFPLASVGVTVGADFVSL